LNDNQNFVNYDEHNKLKARYARYRSNIINKPWQMLLFALPFLLFGIFMMIFSINMIVDTKQKSEIYVETQGIVVDHRYNYDSDGDDTTSIVVEYTVDGKKYRKTSSLGTSNPKPIGTSVPIEYDPNNPSEALLEEDASNLLLICLSLLFTSVGAIMTFKAIKNGIRYGFSYSSKNNTNSTLRFDYSNQDINNIQNMNQNNISNTDRQNDVNQNNNFNNF